MTKRDSNAKWREVGLCRANFPSDQQCFGGTEGVHILLLFNGIGYLCRGQNKIRGIHMVISHRSF